MNDEIRMTNDEQIRNSVQRIQSRNSSFMLRHSFGIRHSCFVILMIWRDSVPRSCDLSA
jgi:hypothetical protein